MKKFILILLSLLFTSILCFCSDIDEYEEERFFKERICNCTLEIIEEAAKKLDCDVIGNFSFAENNFCFGDVGFEKKYIDIIVKYYSLDEMLYRYISYYIVLTINTKEAMTYALDKLYSLDYLDEFTDCYERFYDKLPLDDRKKYTLQLKSKLPDILKDTKYPKWSKRDIMHVVIKEEIKLGIKVDNEEAWKQLEGIGVCELEPIDLDLYVISCLVNGYTIPDEVFNKIVEQALKCKGQSEFFKFDGLKEILSDKSKKRLKEIKKELKIRGVTSWKKLINPSNK